MAIRLQSNSYHQGLYWSKFLFVQVAAILWKFSKKIELRTDLKWPEMRLKVNFGHPKLPMAAIMLKISKILKLHIDLRWPEIRSKKNPYWSKMARNAIESEFRTSKMADGSHFVKKNSKQNKAAYRSEMARNAIESEFLTSKMADGSHYVKI